MRFILSTRHLICVVLEGIYKVAQFGPLNGYPAGVGSDVLAFARKLQDEDFFDLFVERVRGCTFVDEDPYGRNVSYEVLDKIAESDSGIAMENNIAFAADSLWCEWAYVLDLDLKTFEVFKGFNENPLSEDARFRFLPVNRTDYHPVRLVAQWDFEHLPANLSSVPMEF